MYSCIRVSSCACIGRAAANASGREAARRSHPAVEKSLFCTVLQLCVQLYGTHTRKMKYWYRLHTVFLGERKYMY